MNLRKDHYREEVFASPPGGVEVGSGRRRRRRRRVERRGGVPPPRAPSPASSLALCPSLLSLGETSCLPGVGGSGPRRRPDDRPRSPNPTESPRPRKRALRRRPRLRPPPVLERGPGARGGPASSPAAGRAEEDGEWETQGGRVASGIRGPGTPGLGLECAAGTGALKEGPERNSRSASRPSP